MGQKLAEMLTAAMRAKQLTARQLANMMGLDVDKGPQRVGAVLRGEITRPTNWKQYADVLELDSDQVWAAIEQDRAEREGTTIPMPASAKNATRTLNKPFADKMVPVAHYVARGHIPILGRASAGEPDKIVMLDIQTESVPCPPQLAGVEGAYGVFVAGTSMLPRYKPNLLLYVNPHRPVGREDDCVVQIGGPDIDHPSGFVKEFVRRGSGILTLKQYNPLGEIEFNLDEVVAVHLVVGTARI